MSKNIERYKNKILFVIADYYEDISDELASGAKTEMDNAWVGPDSVPKGFWDAIYVPGIFEIPVVISKNIKKYTGFVALGCVIKGQTPHFDFISTAVNNELMNLSTKHNKPIGNGIITSLNMKQAKVRADQFKKNKGGEACKAVLSVLDLYDDDEGFDARSRFMGFGKVKKK